MKWGSEEEAKKKKHGRESNKIEGVNGERGRN